MAYVDWQILGKRLVSCSCDYGCPCEFNAPPTRTPCEGVEGMEIDRGHFGDVQLDGLRVAGIFRWPGAVHEGGGHYLLVIDGRADEAQREALLTITAGEEQEPTTAFNIYGSTIEHEYDPVFAGIEFEWDLDKRRGRLAVPGLLESRLAPIVNPVTGADHRAVIKLPEGFEFREAEIVSADFQAEGELAHEHSGRYGFLTYVGYGPYGVIEEHSYPHAGT